VAAEANVEVVKQALAAWNDSWSREDFDLPPGLLHADVVIDTSANVFNPDLYHGVEGAERLLRGAAEVWESFRMEPVDWAQAGDQVVVLLRTSGRGRESGLEVVDHVTQLWTVRDGLVTAVKVFTSHEDALREAGIEP
jgi:ketosteroid isomerase-like protein